MKPLCTEASCNAPATDGPFCRECYEKLLARALAEARHESDAQVAWGTDVYPPPATKEKRRGKYT